MDVQSDLNILAKALSLGADVLAIFPIVSIPTTTIKVVEDGIALEQAIYTFLTATKEGQEIWARIQSFGVEIGLHLHLSSHPTGGRITVGHPVTPAYVWDPLEGWVLNKAA